MRRIQAWFHSLRVAGRFLPHLRQERLRILLFALLSFAVVALELLRPWPVQWIFDNALAPRASARNATGAFWTAAPSTIVWVGVAASIVIVLAKAAGQYFQEVGLARIEHQVTRSLRNELFAHLSILSPLFHARNKSGDLLVRLTGDVPMVSSMLVNSFLEVTTRALFVSGTVVVMLVLDPLLTAITFTITPALLFVVRWTSRRIHAAVRKQRRREGDLADFVHEAIAANETVQSIGGASQVVRRFARSNRRSARAGVKAKRLSAGLAAGVESLLGLALGSVLAFGSLRVLGGQLSPGELLVFLSYVRAIAKPVRSASKHASNVAKGTACGERILAVLDEEPCVRSQPGAPPAPRTVDELRFEDVGFSYDGRTLALDGFCAAFRRGQLSALVGRSGAGKSTAASLAMRLMDPTAGRVLLNGRSLAELELDSVRSSVGLCLQRTMLFGETLRENLLLGAPEADDAALATALERAGLSDLVAALPEGLETRLGSSGAGLSGGQRSRFSLARTLLRDAPVLIVDEPFAGLDLAATRHVGETLRALARERVVIVIAHDFENIEHYEHIVFLEGGRSAGQGTHASLLEDVPIYREVVRTTAGVAT